MYSATFIFDKKQYDDAFYALDKTIAEAAKETDGYLSGRKLGKRRNRSRL